MIKHKSTFVITLAAVDSRPWTVDNQLTNSIKKQPHVKNLFPQH